MKRLIASLIILLIATTLPASAQNISPELEQQLRALEQTTSQIRGLKASEVVVRQFPSSEEVTSFLIDLFDADLPEEDARKTVLFYAAFDLLPADTDLRAVILDLLSSQVAGFYDPETKVMNVLLLSGDDLGDSLPLLERVTYSHEYIHALQDQHFDLRGIGFDAEASLENPDRVLAIQALVEGDATLGMTEYMQDIIEANPLAGIQLLVQSFSTGNIALPDGTPAILERELLYPYEEGLSFAAALFAEGGWQAINQAFIDLPESTEQVLHPERYLAGDSPQEVTLLPTQEALGEVWTLVWDRPLGEFYLDAHLKTQLPRREANNAAEGWGGDRYHLYENDENGQLAWLLRLAWDTPADAAEFDDAYRVFAEARFIGGESIESCWANGDGALCLSSDAAGTLIAAAPSIDLAQALLDSQGA